MPNHILTKEERAKGGRNKRKKAISDELYELANRITDETGESLHSAINKVIVMQAKRGNLEAIKLYYDRVYGKPTQHNINEEHIIDLPDVNINIRKK